MPASDRSQKRRVVRKTRLTFTRQGKYFIALTLGIGFAAINTGNNLLYLILGMLLSFIVGSGVLSEICLRGLQISRRLPQRVFANEPVLMGISLENSKKRIPSFSLEVEDLVGGTPLDKKCFFLKVPPTRKQRTAYRHSFDRRGPYHFTDIQLATKFPFSLFRKSRRSTLSSEIIVYPALVPIPVQVLRALDQGEESLGRLGRRGEFYGIREFRDTDDPRDIYWRKSARMGRPLICQHRIPAGRKLTIYLDNYEKAEVLAPEDIDRREMAISRAASIAVHFIQSGFSVSLVTRSSAIKYGKGLAHADAILKSLALLQFEKERKPFHAALGGRANSITINTGGSEFGLPAGERQSLDSGMAT
jgi:uncharacterized protein (DUF58 family)